MSTVDDFKGLLSQLFQLDRAELDFGIYRILSLRQTEIRRFMDEELVPEVRKAFEAYKEADRTVLEKKLAEDIAKARELGVDPETTQAVKEDRKKLAEAVDLTALENEVFSDLYTFFSRYYNEGDFISQRRYKDGVYAIPYSGEEVKLHWANWDQYYIKTSENFQTYAFILPSGKKVRFEIKAAATDNDNNGTRARNDKRFFLVEKDFLAEEGGVLVIHFEYKSDPEKKKPADLNAAARDRILKSKGFEQWTRELAGKAPTQSEPGRTLLDKHLAAYTAKNTFDYFIHKDLGTFLRREMDFFIKNEILHLDDIQDQAPERVAQQLSKVKVIRLIAEKIIDFLAQLEDFQKKLWLKKKFVLETQYCFTLDRVPKDFYPEIAKNDAQRDEWVKLFAIDKVLGYSKPLKADFLKANPHLVLDTKHFSDEFKARFLSAISNLDSQLDGLVVHGDNLHALHLINMAFDRGIDFAYIDPPYNSKTTEILYKNNYKHSSWLTLMANRILASQALLKEQTAFVVAIDENEQERLGLLLSDLFPADIYEMTCISIVHNPRGIQGDRFSYTNDYAYFMIPRTEKLRKKELDEAKAKPLMKTGGESLREDGLNMFYPIYVRGDRVSRLGDVPEDDFHPKSHERKLPSGEVEVWPIDSEGKERKWRYKADSLKDLLENVEVRKGRDGRLVPYLSKDTESYRTVWDGAEYNAAEYGSTLLKKMLGSAAEAFSFPKSIHTVKDSIHACLEKSDGVILDFFAGSGTTAHAVIELNREGNGKRKYVLVEMGSYFDKVLLPRIKKAVYSTEWEDAKPTRRDGISHAFKYIRLESYEDALANVRLARSPTQQKLLDKQPALRSEYVLRYMLDQEAKGSPSLLNAVAFEDPFSYELTVTRDGDQKSVKADLVETFNFLLGLKVDSIRDLDGVRAVAGANPEGQRVLVLWRNTKSTSNAALSKWFQKQGYNSKSQDFDLVYVNGSNTLASLRNANQTWQVQLTEDAFHRLMFAVYDV